FSCALFLSHCMSVTVALNGLTALVTALLLAFLPAGSSPSELLQGFAQRGESGKTLGNLNIVPQDILVALL
ncbi:hypothetical protein, partial [Pseudomonas paraeruginosa]|uniref:hypothetical protein n=1 Tax=Pseudomonas paraeruginosa TaxID=2994495 RepID=UPI003F68B9F1